MPILFYNGPGGILWRSGPKGPAIFFVDAGIQRGLWCSSIRIEQVSGRQKHM
jgi:hypothetical protein